jgi:hypothetical protein
MAPRLFRRANFFARSLSEYYVLSTTAKRWPKSEQQRRMVVPDSGTLLAWVGHVMKIVAEYLDRYAQFRRMAESEQNLTVKRQMLDQAEACYRLAVERAHSVEGARPTIQLSEAEEDMVLTLRGWADADNGQLLIEHRDGAWDITLSLAPDKVRGTGATFDQAWDNMN